MIAMVVWPVFLSYMCWLVEVQLYSTSALAVNSSSLNMHSRNSLYTTSIAMAYTRDELLKLNSTNNNHVSFGLFQAIKHLQIMKGHRRQHGGCRRYLYSRLNQQIHSMCCKTCLDTDIKSNSAIPVVNHRPERGKPWSRTINKNNLMSASLSSNPPTSAFTLSAFGVLNAHSVRNKVQNIIDHIIEYDLNIIGFTET